MFGNKARKSVKKGADPIGNSPLTAYAKGKQEWFERCGSPTVERARYFVLAALFGLCLLVLVFALAQSMPLSRAVPFMVTVNGVTGEASPSRMPAEAFKPNAVSKQFFIVRWVRNMMELDPYTTERSLSEAFENTRSTGTEEFTEFLAKTKPIVRVKTETGLTRTVEVKSYSPLNEASSLVRIVTVERSPGKDPIRHYYVVTVHYAIVPPTSETEIMKNPLGLFITHFAINEDMS